MNIGTKAQLIKSCVTKIESFLNLEKGVVIDHEHGVRAGIKGNWNYVQFDSNKYAVPYWCLDEELRVL